MDGNKTDEILDIVRGIADRMATKTQLTDVEVRLTQKIESVSNRLDVETDKRNVLSPSVLSSSSRDLANGRSDLAVKVGALEKQVNVS